MQADLVFVGGVVHSMDPGIVGATAVAVRGERILAVGSDDQVKALVGPRTRVVDLAGRSISPGLTDAHCHLYGLGSSLEAVDLRDVASPEAAAKLAAEAAAKLAKDDWVTGRGWDQNLWPGQAFPTTAVLDAMVSEQPVAFRRVDGHALWANSAALARASIDDATADPEGGKIVRDADGHATGVLVDMAMDLVEDRIPKASRSAIERRILHAAQVASAAGLTTVHEMGISDEVAQVYRALADEHRLPLRVYAFLAGDLKTAKSLASRSVAEQDRDGTQWFVMRGIKMYADGALGSRGAALLAPYSDDPGNQGLWITSAADMKEAARAIADAGWQLGIHAIGDAANRAVLDAFEAAYAEHPKSDLRFRVEHAQILTLDDIPRFAKLGVIASMQPTHATSDMEWADERLGPERLAGAYAWRRILATGAHLAAGSDFPVERVSPLLGLYAAVTRQDAKGHPAGGWLPDQRMTLDEALAAFTREAAYASFVEDQRGRLRSGYVADLTVYDRALAADASLLETQIDMTVVSGEVRFERK